MITRKISDFLKKREFVNVATCDFECRPNVSPKFFLKLEGKYIYLIDYALGKTLDNLTCNPRVALTVMDTDSLTGYQMYGRVRIVRRGPLFAKKLKELRKKAITLSAKRIAEGVRREEKHEMFELNFPDQVVVYKIEVGETVEVLANGQLKKEKV
jgi:predicted pyridoxine 5'-phosphate oxidase superfamily flavin-nucleotide-binding protein